jgi:hypothetical protein
MNIGPLDHQTTRPGIRREKEQMAGEEGAKPQTNSRSGSFLIPARLLRSLAIGSAAMNLQLIGMAASTAKFCCGTGTRDRQDPGPGTYSSTVILGSAGEFGLEWL